MPDVININIGNTDENADWIKGLPGHTDEIPIHEELALQYTENEAPDIGKTLLSTEGSMEDTAEWWRENMPPRYKGLFDATLKEKEADNDA